MTSYKEEKELIFDFFAPIMIAKLRANRFKKHWKNENITNLIKRIDQEIVELKENIKINHQSKIAMEAADVALFCAMIAYISTSPESKK
jgi:NTP pyrophosphatase (non-canonical NTP hydrolase)